MKELILKIEQWAEDRNIIKGTQPIDQAMKLFSEFGELADNVGKGRDCRDDIGDCAVVMTIIMTQCGLSFYDYSESMLMSNYDMKYNVACLASEIAEFVSDIASNGVIESDSYIMVIGWLNTISSNANTTLEECVQIAYNDIKDRKGVVYNGLFIKESDPAYEEALLKVKTV